MFEMDVNREIDLGCEWIANLLEKSGQKKFVMGLSGGIDSAVVAKWAARAVGQDKLFMVSMPYGLLGYPEVSPLMAPSNPASLEDAELVAKSLPNAKYRRYDISPTVDAELTGTDLYRDFNLNHIAFANMKARARALKLRTFANLEQGLVLGTENKTENLLGYFTIGGDEETDVEILSGYFKTEVRMLAKALEVPDEIITKAPSADLWSGQTDEGELGFTYEEADMVLWNMTGGNPNRFTMFVPEAVQKAVLARVEATAFKRAGRPTFSRKVPFVASAV